MKYYSLLTLFLSFSIFSFGQGFDEICPDENTNGVIVNCVEYNDTLYATGFFNQLCGFPVDYIAIWDEDEWQPAQIGITDPGHAMRVLNNQLYVVRYENSIDSNWVYVYQNGDLEKVGEGIYLTTATGQFSNRPNIYDVAEYNGNLIACGEFDRVGDSDATGIMQYDGNEWSAIGGGLSGGIQGGSPLMFPHQLMVHNNELYVCGNFRFAGGVEVNGIAKWDGTSWSNMGAGFNETVYSMIVYNDEIYAGGAFTESDGVEMNRIAKWNGTSWEPLNFGFIPLNNFNFTFVHTMTEIDGLLYMAGGLTEILFPDESTEICGGLISYDGENIDTFSGGVPDNDIEAVYKLDNGQLLIGGGVFGTGYSGLSNFILNTSDISSKIEVAIAPNPVDDLINISSSERITSYEVLDQSGRLVQRGEYSEMIEFLHAPGLYLIQLYEEDEYKTTAKFLKK